MYIFTAIFHNARFLQTFYNYTIAQYAEQHLDTVKQASVALVIPVRPTSEWDFSLQIQFRSHIRNPTLNNLMASAMIVTTVLCMLTRFLPGAAAPDSNDGTDVAYTA